MKTVLVTGGLGFVGIHSVYVLLKKGYKVIIIDSLYNSDLKILENLENLLKLNNIYSKENLKFFKGDIRDYKFLNFIF